MRVMTVGVLGGLLGILMMIPLRRAFIVKQHGMLTYPEGTACADVLIVGEEGGATAAKTVFAGFGLAFVHKFVMTALHLWNEDVNRAALHQLGRQGIARRRRSAASWRRNYWAWATSSARRSPRSWWPAACWRTWCWCR